MRTIRENVFETNSSSCHCVTIAGENMLEKYKKGEVVCIHKFGILGHENIVEIVPDSDFITIDDLADRIRNVLAECPDVPSYFAKELSYLTNNFSKGTLVKCLKNEYSVYDAITFENETLYYNNIADCIKYILDFSIRYYNKSNDDDPLVDDSQALLDYSNNISGPIKVISSEISC